MGETSCAECPAIRRGEIRYLSGAAAALLTTTASAVADDDWQLKRLMQPTTAQLAQEVAGSVVIYDGLDARQVNRALDTHYDRMQHMMFIRIHHLPPPGAGGEAVVESDGCD